MAAQVIFTSLWTVHIVVCVTVLAYVQPAAAECRKPLLFECYGNLPVPFSLLPYAEVTRMAVEVRNHDADLTSTLFAIPTSKTVNRTCAVYHSLRQCDRAIINQCRPAVSNRYLEFRAAYDYMCGMIGRLSHLNNVQCLTENEELQQKVESCLSAYVSELEDLIYPGNATRVQFSSELVKQERYCWAQQKLKQCSMSAVDAVCGQYSREFWFQVNFPFSRNLDVDNFCKDEKIRVRQLNATLWRLCADGSNVISSQYFCDRDRDCFDGQDEEGCEYVQVSPRIPTGVIVGIIVVIVLVIIVVLCIVKCVQETQYKKKRRSYLSDNEKQDSGIEVKEPLKGGKNNSTGIEEL